MAQVKLMTQSEYAKHRGVSAVAVHKAVKEKRISTMDGKIDPVVADIQWGRNTRVRVHAPKQDNAQGQVPLSTATTAPLPTGTERAPDGKAEDYWESRGRREKAEAAIAEMKEAEMRGTLIRADVVRSALASKISAARDALLQIPSRLAPVLAAETDLERVTEVLEAELRQALAQLSSANLSEGSD